jgi:ParB family chromosome partitioning protein
MCEVQSLPIELVHPNSAQPRKHFDPAALQELAGSIAVSGLMQPIIVAPQCTLEGPRYMIIAGERRWRAMQLAGKPTIPAIVREDLDAQGIADLALIENLLRRDLTLMEEARAYQAELDGGHSLESLAKLLGLKQPHRITERTRLLQLDPKFQDALERGIINPSQATELSGLSTEGQFALWRHIQNGMCDSYNALRRMAAAVKAAEQQQSLFRDETKLTDRERNSLSRVDRFIAQAGALISSITEDDLSVIEDVRKSDAAACIERLTLLASVCKQLTCALQTNLARQQVEFYTIASDVN